MKEELILNPISSKIKDSISETRDKLKIAVPFISSFAKKIINSKDTIDIYDKRLITKFDESNLNTFDVLTLDYLIDCGFQICFNNNIHLKLYITDSNVFITSSNLTNGGFEKNVELSVSLEIDNFEKSNSIFDNLWEQSKSNIISKELLSENLDKYKVLKKRQKHTIKELPELIEKFESNSINIQKILSEIVKTKHNYTDNSELVFKANQFRNKFKTKLRNNKFDDYIFYAPKGHSERYNNLFYEFVYGHESKLAGTGLREAQFKSVFENTDFKNIISFIYPESIGLKPWNLNDAKSKLELCNGIFDYQIPQYSETLPIRLVSFFYPEHFISIFKLNHLQKVCNTFNKGKILKSKGDQLFEYNFIIQKILQDVPFNEYTKSNVIYQIHYYIEMYERMQDGETFETIKDSHKQKWIKNYFEMAKNISTEINSV